MKKLAIFAVLLVAGVTAIAATCRVVNVSLNEIDGDPAFSGELRNETAANFLGHRIVVAFLDEDGNVLQTRTVEGCLRSLQANSSDFFTATSSEDPNDVEVGLARLALDNTLKVGDTARGDLIFTNIKATRSNNGDDIVVTGTVKNDSGDTLNDVRVCIVVKDGSGTDAKITVVARDNDTFDLDDNESANFSVSFKSTDDDDDNDKVDVWADGLNDDDGDKPSEPQVDEDNDIDECDAATATATGTPPTQTPTNSPTATPTGTLTPVATATPVVDDAC